MAGKDNIKVKNCSKISYTENCVSYKLNFFRRTGNKIKYPGQGRTQKKKSLWDPRTSLQKSKILQKKIMYVKI